MRLLLWRAFQLLAIIGSLSGLVLVLTLNPARCAPSCRGANLAGSTLNGANLRGVILVEANLSNVLLERAVLSGADLAGAIVTAATLLNADLSGATLVGADFSGSDMRGSNLFAADLSGANLTGVNLTRVDLRGATSLHGLLLDDALMVEAQLTETDLSGVELNGANLTGANLEGANLSGANLSGARLAGANLREADLSGAWLNLADLTGADLSGASLAGAMLLGSTVASASFNEANLSGATAIGANFDGADLRGANISGARFLESDSTDLDAEIDPLVAALSESEISKVLQNARLKGVHFDDTVVWSPDSKAALETLLGFQLTAPAAAKPTEVGGVELGEVEPARQEGTITIAGSATLYPMTRAIADKFSAAGFPGTLTVESSDSGPGFERLCKQGSSDIANASRAITDEESEACAALRRAPLGFRIGTDAVVIVVHPGNDFLTDATLVELQRIFTADSWSDVNPRWPREPIERFVPAAGSGTRDFFEQTVGVSEDDLGAASNTTASQDLGALGARLAASPYGIGVLSYAAFQQFVDQLQTIKVDGVAPNYQNVEAGRYLLARPLYIYTDAVLLQKKPQVAAFITFYLQQATATSQESGFFPPSEAVLKESAERLQQALAPAN